MVGYGLDYADYYRNLPYIAVLKEDEVPRMREDGSDIGCREILAIAECEQ